MQPGNDQQPVEHAIDEQARAAAFDYGAARRVDRAADMRIAIADHRREQQPRDAAGDRDEAPPAEEGEIRSEEHTSELQSLMRISYAVFCLKKKKTKHN